MFPLGILSIWMWGLIFFKSDWVWRAGRRALRISEALDFLAGRREQLTCSPDCPRGAALRHFKQHWFQPPNRFAGEADRLLLQASILRQYGTIDRHLTAILVLAAAAPLIGLLGTVTGMVDLFQAMATYGSGNPRAMAAGIKTALITTQAGLLVAIPGLMAGQVLKRKVRTIHHNLFTFQQAVAQWLDKECRRCSGSTA